jgi:hypothetical protein
LIGGHFENDDHEGAHQEGSVDHFVAWLFRGAVVEDSIFLIVVVAQEASELSRISVNHRQVQWAKVFVEGEVSQVVINVKEKCIFEVLRRPDIRDPKEFV